VSEPFDFIVVGSGPCGAIAANTLVSGGARVQMLDAGILPEDAFSSSTKTNYEQKRKEGISNSDYFLGNDAADLLSDDISTGAQLTPSRKFMVSRVRELLPLLSDSFFPMESLSYGGLGNGWGLGCCVFSEAELKRCGLDPQKMHLAYKEVAELIGISGADDDAAQYTCGKLQGIMKPLQMDRNASGLLNAYTGKRADLNRKGFYLGRPSLALLTEPKDNRSAYRYDDLDFYSNDDTSAWRPRVMLEKLKGNANFNYSGNAFVKGYSENEGIIRVSYTDLRDSSEKEAFCRKLILASGTLGTARLVLRSSEKRDSALPLICNPYYYIPSIQWRMIGKGLGEKPVGLAQLSLFEDRDNKNEDVAMGSIYSYHSLMLYRLILQAPLDMRSSAKIFRNLLPALTIFGIHHPESAGSGRFQYNGKAFSASYEHNDEMNAQVIKRNKRFVSVIKKLGCYPVRTVDPGFGASIHYAGTLPFAEGEEPFSLDPTGRLHGSKNIYVADGSGFRYLPAKGLTFSLMAWAHVVAKNLISK